MRNFMVVGIGTIGLLGLLASSVHATSFNFSYEFSNMETFSGMLEGEIQSDLNTILITGASGLIYSGSPALPFNNVFNDSSGTFGSGLLSLDGTSWDIRFHTEPGHGGVSAAFQVISFSPRTSIRGTNVTIVAVQGIDSTRWTIEEKASATVPEPSSILLFGTGVLGLMGWAARRRKTVH